VTVVQVSILVRLADRELDGCTTASAINRKANCCHAQDGELAQRDSDCAMRMMMILSLRTCGNLVYVLTKLWEGVREALRDCPCLGTPSPTASGVLGNGGEIKAMASTSG